MEEQVPEDEAMNFAKSKGYYYTALSAKKNPIRFNEFTESIHIGSNRHIGDGMYYLEVIDEVV